MLEARAISRSYGSQVVLNSIDLSVAPREVVGLVGMNGSGKTTLLEVLSGKIRPDAGEVWVDGVRVMPRRTFAPRPPVFRSYQVPRLFYGLSVKNNLLMGRWALGTDHRSFDIGRSELTRNADTLSIGQRRRVVLDWVRARIGRAKYLLLDEPAAGGDEALVSLLLELVNAARVEGCGVLLVEHRDGLLKNACDRIVYLHNGVCADAPNANGCGSMALSMVQTRHLDPKRTVPAARLAVQNLSVIRGGALVLKAISFHAYTGEVVVLTGANGSGKSTLLRAIYGDPSCLLEGGQVISEGRNLSRLSLRQRLARGVHLMPQDGTLFSSMTVEESLCSSVEAVNLNGWDANAVKDLRRKLPLLDNIWLRKCGLLSGGERRLVLLSRVVLLKPLVALLDEPLAGVDVNTREQVVGLIRELAQGGAAVIIAEQEALTHLIPAERFLRLSGSKQCSMAAASE